MFRRSSAMAAPGIVLSQATSATMPSNMCPRATSSMESAITSRLTSEAFMPSVPMVMPSLMAMVLYSIGVPARGADAFGDLDRQVAQLEVARHGADPGVGDADDRLFQIFVGESDGFQLRAGRRAVPSLGDRIASKWHVNLLW